MSQSPDMSREEAEALVDELVRRSEAATVRWCPHDPTSKQRLFLGLDNLEALYGGAAGGGKSDALLMGALEDVNEAGYAALLLRRTFQDLALPGAIMERSQQWLAETDAHWNGSEKRWTFPGGATVSFGYLETEQDKYRYQSSEFQYIGVDELTQFSETQHTYMLSRIRRPAGSKLRLRSRSATNPGGRGHEWVKRRFVDPATRGERAFVPATLEDNPHIDQLEYEKALALLDATTQAQLRRGLWVRDTGGLVYKYNADRNAVQAMPDNYPETWRHVLGVDLGASESKPTTAFAVLGYCRTDLGVYVVESEKRAAMIPSTIAERIQALSKHYGGFQQIVIDQGGLGRGYIEEFRQRHTIPAEPAEKQNKLGYRKLLNGDFESGRVHVVEHANAELIEELNGLPWNEDGDDNEEGADNHCTDALLYAWRAAKHWLAKLPKETPAIGTAERAQWEADQMKARRIEQMKARKEPYWKRRGA